MDTSDLARAKSPNALRRAEQLAYRRGVQDGLARTPATVDPLLAREAPALVRAYGDGYQWGARHRPRFASLLARFRLGRRGRPALAR